MITALPAARIARTFVSREIFKSVGLKKGTALWLSSSRMTKSTSIPFRKKCATLPLLVEPLTIAEKGLTQVWQVQQRLPWSCSVTPGKAAAYRHRAVVLGAGPVGLLGAMALVNNDFDTYVYSREPAPNPKSQLLESIGAHYISLETITPEMLPQHIGNIDLVYEATGASNLSFEMMKYLGTNGILSSLAFLEGSDPSKWIRT